MKRLAAAAVATLVLLAPGVIHAASLRPIDAEGLNLRSGPGTNYAVVGGLAFGQAATVTAQSGEWFKIRTGSGLEAWAAGEWSNISFRDEEAYAIVNTDVLNFRKEPNLTAPVIGSFSQNQKVRLLYAVGKWWQVSHNGQIGWVASEYMLWQGGGTTPPPPPGPTPPPAPTPPPPSQGWTPPPAAPPSSVPVLPPSVYPTPPVAGKLALAKSAAGVHIGRYTSLDRVDSLVVGERLTLLDLVEGWARVRTPRGRTGWTPASSLTLMEGDARLEMSTTLWAIRGVPTVASAPAVAQTDVAPTAIPAAASEEAVATAAAVQVGEERKVTSTVILIMRAEPNLRATPVRSFRQGALLQVLEEKGEWIRVSAAGGWSGWVQSKFTGPSSVQPTPPPAPVPTPPPAPVPPPSPVGGTLNAELRLASPGLFRLSLQGASGQPVASGNTLFFPGRTNVAQPIRLPVGLSGAKEMTLSSDGLRISWESLPAWKVMSAAQGNMLLEIQSSVTAVTRTVQADRTIIGIKLAGRATPSVTATASNVTVTIPGATVAAGDAVPSGVSVVADGNGAHISVSSRRAYAIFPSADGYELHLYTPGLAGKTILLDPGHGGNDPGASNRNTGIVEHDVNLDNALRLRPLLEAKGAKVLLTRRLNTNVAPPAELAKGTPDGTNADLGHRVRMANELPVDMFLSIHHNAGDAYRGGTEVFYSSTTLNGARSRVLAQSIQSQMVSALGTYNRGAKDELFYVTRNTFRPAVLIEIAFLDHTYEGPRLKTDHWQNTTANAIVRGLEAYFAER